MHASKPLLLIPFLLVACRATGTQTCEATTAGWLEAHNSGDDIAIVEWIEASYAPEYLDGVSIEDHIAFYRQVMDDFGALDPEPLEVVESEPLHRVVHYRRAGDPESTPETTLVVEIELSPEDPERLVQSLGLGALVCDVFKQNAGE